MDAESALLTKQEQTLTEQLESLRKGAADQEQINRMLKEKLEEAQNQLKKNEHSKESEEMLKNELFTMQTGASMILYLLSLTLRRNREVKSESYQHASDRILALETENKELQQKLTELTQELSKQKQMLIWVFQQCKARAELTMERALFKKEREMQELLRQADKENACLEVLLEQAREQLKKENIDKDEQ